jgi:hypothetical protein
MIQNAEIRKRLGDEVPGPEPHGPQGVLHHAHPGQDHDGRLGSQNHRLLDERIAIHHRHVQIHDNGPHRFPVRRQDIQALAAVPGLQDLVVHVLEMGAKGTAQPGLVIDDQNGHA